MKKILISILLIIFIFTPVYSSEKIVYLDIEKIMQSSIAGKSIITQLKKKREASISKFKKKEKDIIDKEKKLIAQKNVLSKEEFETKIIELRKEILNFQKERNKTSNEIARSRVKASTKLISKLSPILEEYSNKNSIRIIVQKKNIVMGKKEDDITKDILELVNQKVKNIKLD
ncbi:MAG: OmpH family outer membrane protein [Candidatus Pelagibacter sp.]|tara:strand:+ start:2907 stop:3425 length:519 start_codon:yes stop_codon:yes gene_type:complete